MPLARWAAVIAGALALIAPGALPAQTDARLTGYWEHQFSLRYAGGDWRQLDYDRFRADLSARAGRTTHASVGIVWQLYRGHTTVAVGDALPAAFAVPDSLTIALENRQFVNHAYVTLRPGPFEITAGKQYLTWGASFVFNPTELFRPKDLFEPTYEREGVGAISMTLPLGPLSNALVAYAPDGGFETSAKIVRVRHHLAGFDLSVLAAELHEQPGPAASDLRLPATERRRVLGGDVTGELLGLGVWAEGTWSERADERWIELTVGGNYTLSDGTLLTAEGFLNGRGQVEDPYPIGMWLGRLYGDRRTLGRTALYLSASRPWGDLWRISASTIANPGDQSAALIPAVSCAFAENVDLLVNLVFTIGPDGTEYGTGGHGGFVRARVYF